MDLPKQVSAVKNIAESAGLRVVKKWNISQLLANAKGLAIRVPDGWELTTDGKKKVKILLGPEISSPIATAIPLLRSHLSKISSPNSASFVEEAIKCLEIGLLRSGIVLSWVGAVSVLYDEVIKSHLASFNAEALKRDPKWKLAKNIDDLARMKEFDFLNVAESCSILGKSVKQELEACLKLRNACGHPNQLKIGEARANAHIESLILNVFSVYQ